MNQVLLNQLEIHKMRAFLDMTWYNMHMEMCIFLLQSWSHEALHVYPYEQDQIRSSYCLLSFFQHSSMFLLCCHKHFFQYA